MEGEMIVHKSKETQVFTNSKYQLRVALSFTFVAMVSFVNNEIVG